MRGLVDLWRQSRQQWRTPDHIRRWQSQKLRRLVAHAYRQIPPYRRVLDQAGIDPQRFRGLDDLTRLPRTTKRDLQLWGWSVDDAQRATGKPCHVVRTSGSTGLPLELIFTSADLSVLNASWVRAALAHGARLRDRRLKITGPHHIRSTRSWFQHLGFWCEDGVSVFEEPSRWVTAFCSCRPEILWGYSNTLKLFARHVLETRLQDIEPRLVFGVSEPVDEECREMTREAFGAEAIDLYGAAETGLIGWQCPICRGLHLNEDTVIVELLRMDRPARAGERGRVVVTNLHSAAMPIIRYELEDVGRAPSLPATCGRGLALLDSVEGRADSFLVAPSGRILSPLLPFMTLHDPVPGVRQWQVLQETPDRLTVSVVADTGYSDRSATEIRDRFRRDLGEEVRVDVRVVSSIRSESGKLCSTISKVATDLRPGDDGSGPVGDP